MLNPGKSHTVILAFTGLVAVSASSITHAAISTSGDVSTHYNSGTDPDNPWNPAFLDLAQTADGQLDVDGGSSVQTSIYAGYNPGFTGTINITGTGSSIFGITQLGVGATGGTGILNLSAGAQIIASGQSELGNNAGTHGEINADGTGTMINDAGYYVGSSGTGVLKFTGGAQGTLGAVQFGVSSNGVGTFEVSGAGTNVVTSASRTLIGGSGTGTLNVLNGGVLETQQGVGAGAFAGGSGQINVTGAGSRLQDGGHSGYVTIGNSSGQEASLNITQGGHMDMANSYNEIDSYSTDTVVTLADAGSKYSTGVLDIGSSNGTRSIVNVGAGTTLATERINNGSGTININGGTVTDKTGQFAGLLIGNGGIVNFNSGLLKLESPLTVLPGGQFNFAGGEIESNGDIDLGAIFAQQGGRIAPGSSPGTTTIIHGYSVDGGDIEIELFGTTAGSEYDQIIVQSGSEGTGAVNLIDADLDLVLGFAGEIGDTFTILTSAAGITGQFNQGTSIFAGFGLNQYGFLIDYTAGGGNNIVLTLDSITSIPEPTSIVLFAMTATGAMMRRRGA